MSVPPSMTNTRIAASACTGGLTSSKFHSYAGSAPLGCRNHSRSSTISWYLAKAGSRWAQGIAWNARSQAANHGYSHGSGMASTSKESRWPPVGVPSAAARPRAAEARQGRRRATCSRRRDRSACSRPARRSPDARPASAPRRCPRARSRRRTRRPRVDGQPGSRRTSRSDQLGPADRRPPPAGAAGDGSPRVPPAGTVRWYHQAALVPSPAGLTVAAPETTWSLIPSFGYAVTGARAVQTSGVGLVVAEHRPRQLTVRARRGLEPVSGEPVVLDHDGVAVLPKDGHVRRPPPRQVLRNHRVGSTSMRRLVRAAVLHGDAREDLGRRGLGVGDLHGPEPVVVEHAGVEQLVLEVLPAAARVLLDQVLVRERGLRVVVAPAQQGVAGQPVEIPPVLLDVLTVVALRDR